MACIQYSSKPSEDAKENCISNYQTGEFNSENVLKIAENKGLTRLDIQEAANNIIEATNKKRKRDSDMLRDFKKTAEYQVSCDILITTVGFIHISTCTHFIVNTSNSKLHKFHNMDGEREILIFTCIYSI